MYEYTNPEYYSKVHDFGDNYHRPDEEIYRGFNAEMMKQLRSLKRKYRDFAEFCEAKDLYNRYAEMLFEKYGGKKKFKFLQSVGLVQEFIPFCPELRKIKKNRKYIKYNAPLVETVERETPPTQVKVYDPKVYIGKKTDIDKNYDIRDSFHAADIKDSISHDLELLDKFYKRRVAHPTKLSHREDAREKMRRRYLDHGYIPVKKKMKDYLYKKMMKEYDEDRIDPKSVIFYKDVSMSAKESQEIETYNWLKSMGIRSKKTLSKAGRKVVRRSEMFNPKKKKKKDKKKKKGLLRTKYLKEYTDKEYHTFESFERDMLDLTELTLKEKGDAYYRD